MYTYLIQSANDSQDPYPVPCPLTIKTDQKHQIEYYHMFLVISENLREVFYFPSIYSLMAFVCLMCEIFLAQNKD